MPFIIVFIALLVALVLMKRFRGHGVKLVYAIRPKGEWKIRSVLSIQQVKKSCPCCFASAVKIVAVELTSTKYFPGSKNLGTTTTINALQCKTCGALLAELPSSDNRVYVTLS